MNKNTWQKFFTRVPAYPIFFAETFFADDFLDHILLLDHVFEVKFVHYERFLCMQCIELVP